MEMAELCGSCCEYLGLTVIENLIYTIQTQQLRKTALIAFS
uniref:Alternative protein JHDM1D n=1 Tax=Homo sapiens TaxID=9606 RepID=L8E8U8_HUMAN|nr:alternative protein JHDM1D [Homo sapiens]